MGPSSFLSSTDPNQNHPGNEISALERILAPAAIIACLKLLPFRFLLHYGMRIDLHPVESIGEQLAKSKDIGGSAPRRTFALMWLPPVVSQTKAH